MVLYLGTIVLAALVVVVTRGSFRRLGQIELRAVWLLLLALAIQVVLEFVTFPKARIDDVGFGLLMLSFALIMTFCILNVNVRTIGFAIIAVGVGLNMLVIGLNQGMPTKDEVHVRNGHEVHVPIERTVKHRPQESDDKLVFLSDQLTVPGIPNVQYSIGDIVIALGIVYVCFEASRRPRRNGVYLDRVRASG